MGASPTLWTLRCHAIGSLYGYSENPYFCGPLRVVFNNPSKCQSLVKFSLNADRMLALPMRRSGYATSTVCVLHEETPVGAENNIVTSSLTTVPIVHSPCVLGHEDSSEAAIQEIGVVNTVKIREAAYSGEWIPPLPQRKGAHVRVLGRKIWCRSSSSAKKNIWVPERKLSVYQKGKQILQSDHLINIDELLNSLKGVASEEELHQLMEDWKGKLSLRLMVLVLNRERDWQRALALHDWMIEKGGYRPSIFGYNIVLRNILRARRWSLGEGLVNEMRERHVSPDKFTYSTLISNFSKAGKLDSALKWLQEMERERIVADLIAYSTLIELARKQKNYSKAISLFTKLKAVNLCPDLILYNTMINVFGKVKLYGEAKDLILEMKDHDIAPDTESYRMLLNAYAENGMFQEALTVFSEMKSAECPADLTTCNIMINVYGQLDMVDKAERVFWSMKKTGILPNVVTHNTMLKMYGEADLISEAIHLFNLMQKTDIEQNVITYNTMINIYGKTLDYGKATKLLLEMQKKGIEPNTITFSTIISLYGKAQKYEEAAHLFQKLRSSGFEIDAILYQCMIMIYERAGLVSHANRLFLELKHHNDVSREIAITILAKAGKVEEAGWHFRKAFDAGEVQDISVFECMIDLFARNKKYSKAIDAYEKLRQVGLFPGSETVAILLSVYEKLELFEKGEALYGEMQEEGCIFSHEVHFQMMNLHAARGNLEAVVSLFENLESREDINKKELYLTLANILERSDRIRDVSCITKQMEMKKLQLSLAN